MDHYLLGQILCGEYDQNFRWTGGNPNVNALLFECNLKRGIDNDPEILQILIFGPHNYVGVWARVIDDPMNPHQVDGEIDANSWHLFSYHDSCWRTDGIDHLLFNIQRQLSTIHIIGCNQGWYKRLTLTPEQVETLMGYVRYRDRHGSKPPMPKPLADELKRSVKN